MSVPNLSNSHDGSAKAALITGGSRGIGAETALEFARRGVDICINYRSKAARADEVAAQVAALGRKCIALQADLTEESDLQRLASEFLQAYGKIDYLVMNAAGGLEKGKGDDDSYARALNVTANHRLLDLLLPGMPLGRESSVVFVTSHPSHFYGQLPGLAGYDRVASTKKEAEDTLRKRIPEMDSLGVRLAIISGDLIEGTINAKLLQREYPGLMAARVAEVGPLPNVAQFSAAIVDTAMNSELAQGATVLIGSTEWQTYSRIHEAEKLKQAGAISGEVS